MEKSIYVVSRCLGESAGIFHFHFIGYFNGVRIKEIFVEGGGFSYGEDYILVLDSLYIKQSSLYGSLIKSKKVFT